LTTDEADDYGTGLMKFEHVTEGLTIKDALWPDSADAPPRSVADPEPPDAAPPRDDGDVALFASGEEEDERSYRLDDDLVNEADVAAARFPEEVQVAHACTAA